MSLAQRKAAATEDQYIYTTRVSRRALLLSPSFVRVAFFSPIVMPPRYKQQPTLEGVRIRTEQDALLVFYGVARGILTLLTRRLDADERKAIEPGHVYVWEDRSATTSDSGGLSMERW